MVVEGKGTVLSKGITIKYSSLVITDSDNIRIVYVTRSQANKGKACFFFFFLKLHSDNTPGTLKIQGSEYDT